MQDNQINRRGFLRLCFLGASGVIATACGAQPDFTLPPQETLAATPRFSDGEAKDTGWVDKAVVYRLMPGEDGSSSFKRIAQRLDALQELGVNVLWLGEVARQAAGEGHAVSGTVHLNPQYGGREEFQRLVEQAHRHGMRVLIDFPLLPSIEAFSSWVREFDLDGFRVDSAWERKDSLPEFWPEWRREMKGIKPDLLLVAEASAGDPFFFENGFDAAQDWTDQAGHWAWELVFKADGLLTSNLHAALTNRPGGYHPGARILRSLNLDSRARFVSKYGLEKTKLATAMLFTLPGIPFIYAGDEVGETYPPGSTSKPAGREENNLELLEVHKQFIKLRKEVPSLHSRRWLPLEVEPFQQVYGFLRYLEPNDQPVLVLLNFFEPEVEVEVNLPPEFRPLFAESALEDLLTGEAVQAAGLDPFRVRLQGNSVKILRQTGG